MLSIVVPTYNEAENVSLLNVRVARALAGIDYELVFVDDSTDETPLVLTRLSKRDERIRFLHREKERGLASAVVQGFKLAKGEYLAVLDADLQHPPELLPTMLKALGNGADIVIPSRFVTGGNDGGLRLHRKLVSWVARVCGKVMLKRLRGISDITGGFFALRREVIQGIHLNPIGWKILIEVLVKGEYSKIAELPYAFSPRTHNKSKMSVAEQVNYLKHLVRLVNLSPEDFKFWQLVKREGLAFAVGGLVFYLVNTVLDGETSALLAALAYVPANRLLNLPRQRKRVVYAPKLNSSGRFVNSIAPGVGVILLVYWLGIRFIGVREMTAYLLGSGLRTCSVALSAAGVGVSLKRLLKREEDPQI
ncbi:MAG TPA: polyprenol monophosphomannose synthase [Verrucomicrobiae bacterium]|nr:polyprenol monophosphomannose synthase [Verrucomicrobiae bacterium]